MAVAIITGVAGLIGAEAARHFRSKGLDVVGIDNDARKIYFGESGSTLGNLHRLEKELQTGFKNFSIDIRDPSRIDAVFENYGNSIKVVLHTAAQPSHDWALKDPSTDFGVNASGTLNVLESTRKFSPNAVFLFTSTNRIYGDAPNNLPLLETETRFELSREHPYFPFGIDEKFESPNPNLGLFGLGKLTADLLCQEYQKTFGLVTGVFRGGCLTGSEHAAASLHGYLAYLIRCLVQNRPYTVFGYGGKQVRDNIHAKDFVNALWHFFENPKSGAIYNLGGSRINHGSLLEMVGMAEETAKKKLDLTFNPVPRRGDHKWWISDTRKFQNHYPSWAIKYRLDHIIDDLLQNIPKI